MSRLIILALSIFGIILTHLPAAANKRPVVLELVLAVDTSTSVDKYEFNLQREGLARAFEHPDIVSVIQGMGNTGIAVTLVEWAGRAQQAHIVDWSLLNSESSSLQFASRVRAAPRAFEGMTAIGNVIEFATASIAGNRFEGARKVIDVSGDGTSNTSDTAIQRDRAVNLGITINGLVIFQREKEYDLGELAEIDLLHHFTNQVIGGDGAFLMTARSFEDFEVAIRNKLLREILGIATANLDRVIQ